MKSLIRFALYLAWFWLKKLPLFAFYWLGVDGNEAERVQMEKDLDRLSHLEKACEAHFHD